MMRVNFDEEIDRRGTKSLKYDFAVQRGVPADVLPMWVADMDFRVAPGITERLQQAVNHGIYGYTESDDAYAKAVIGWFSRNHGWTPKVEWLVKTPGVVYALGQAIQAYTKPGDAILIQQPVYYPFGEAIRDNGRRLISNSLVLKGDRYEIDFEDFEEKIVVNEVKVFLLCSPHNPVGRVWSAEELRRMEEICLKHGVVVVADEIHGDFTWGEHTFAPLLSLDERYEANVIVCTAPSKTFNIAGLQVSNIFIPNEQLREQFKHAIAASGYSQLNAMGLFACQAAYETGQDWYEQVKEYIWSNVEFAADYVEKNLPQIKMLIPEGTYLVWMDFRGLNLTEEQRQDLILNKAHLWLDSGAIFGKDGEGFERFNVACTRATLLRALEQLKAAIDQL